MTPLDPFEGTAFIHQAPDQRELSDEGATTPPVRRSHFEGTVTLECTLCGVVFERDRARAKHSRRHYCTKPCPGALKEKPTGGKRGRPRLGPNHACETCGTPMRRTPGQVQQNLRRFCSMSCRSAWLFAQRPTFQCEWCGTSFRRSPCRKRQGTVRFCSRSCSSKCTATSQLRRETPNQPERAVHRMLKQLGFGFSTNMLFKRWNPDVVVHNSNVVIQVFGIYWHDKHRTSTDPRIQRTVKRDEQTIAALTEAGWKVLVLWEDDINQRPKWCKKEIARAVISAHLDQARVRWNAGEIEYLNRWGLPKAI